MLLLCYVRPLATVEWFFSSRVGAFDAIPLTTEPRSDTGLFAGVSGVAQANQAFSPAFDAAYTTRLERKFGLCGMKLGSGWMHPSRSDGGGAGSSTKDAQFVLEFFRLMSACRVDFTDTWRALLGVPALSAAHNVQRRSGTPLHLGADDTEAGDGHAGASGIQKDAIYGNHEEELRPLLPVLTAAGASSEQMREWATWVHEYSSRIDTQGIGKSHPDGEDEGRAVRLEIMRESSPAFVLRAESLEQALKAADMGGKLANSSGQGDLEGNRCTSFSVAASVRAGIVATP